MGHQALFKTNHLWEKSEGERIDSMAILKDSHTGKHSKSLASLKDKDTSKLQVKSFQQASQRKNSRVKIGVVSILDRMTFTLLFNSLIALFVFFNNVSFFVFPALWAGGDGMATLFS